MRRFLIPFSCEQRLRFSAAGLRWKIACFLSLFYVSTTMVGKSNR